MRIGVSVCLIEFTHTFLEFEKKTKFFKNKVFFLIFFYKRITNYKWKKKEKKNISNINEESERFRRKGKKKQQRLAFVDYIKRHAWATIRTPTTTTTLWRKRQRQRSARRIETNARDLVGLHSWSRHPSPPARIQNSPISLSLVLASTFNLTQYRFRIAPNRVAQTMPDMTAPVWKFIASFSLLLPLIQHKRTDHVLNSVR